MLGIVNEVSATFVATTTSLLSITNVRYQREEGEERGRGAKGILSGGGLKTRSCCEVASAL